MPTVYPINLPMYAPTGGLSPRSVRVAKKTAISQSQAPSSFVQQTYVWSGQLWSLGISWPPALRDKAEPLVAALSSLNGMEGSVLLPISSNLLPRGGSPALGTQAKVNGGSQTGYDLVTDGWPVSVPILKAGDWIQLGGRNLLLNSQHLASTISSTTGVANSPWVGNHLLFSDYIGGPSPDGSSTTGYLLPDGGTDPHVYQDFLPAGQFEHTFSVWLRKGAGTAGFAPGLFANDAATGINLAATLCPVTIGVWTRYSITFKPLSPTGLVRVFIGGANTFNLLGELYVWGAQVDPLPYPQQYRATTSAQYNQPYQLYKVVNDTRSDSAGNATLTLWPKLRTSPADNSIITYDYPVGKFMLISGDNWDIDTAKFYGLDASFMEDLRG